jgi:hypothetical protein
MLFKACSKVLTVRPVASGTHFCTRSSLIAILCRFISREVTPISHVTLLSLSTTLFYLGCLTFRPRLPFFSLKKSQCYWSFEMKCSTWKTCSAFFNISHRHALATRRKINTVNRKQTPAIQSGTETHMDLWNSAMGDSLKFQHRNPPAFSVVYYGSLSDPFWAHLGTETTVGSMKIYKWT